MTYRELLNHAKGLLKDKSNSPYLDALIILESITGLSRERLYASLKEEPETSKERLFLEILEKRSHGVPVAYLTGEKEFYGRNFLVASGVLIPRPDTETLLESAIRLTEENPWIRDVHDACTGSGCIAITLKAEVPHLNISASDISTEARKIFLKNCRNLLGSPLPFFLSDLLLSVQGSFDLLVSNPPYLTTREREEFFLSGSTEPALALEGGADGLSIYRRLIHQSMEHLKEKGYLILEIDSRRVSQVEDLCLTAGFLLRERVKDIGKRERVIIVQKNNFLG